jgi:hypothetical protein
MSHNSQPNPFEFSEAELASDNANPAIQASDK